MLYNAGKGGATALWVFSLKDKKAARFDAVESPATTLTGAVFSPDGRWVAYASREGRTSSAVYVQPFPPTGAKYQISKNADDGHHPMWSPDGAELLFTPGQGPRLNAVRVTTRPSFTFSEAMPVPRPFQDLGPLSNGRTISAGMASAFSGSSTQRRRRPARPPLRRFRSCSTGSRS